MKRTFKITTQLMSLAAVALFVSLSANSAAAQQRARVQVQVQDPNQRICVSPPREICCTPKLGFRGAIVCDGMRIDHVQRWSKAAEMGLEPGDVILRVNGRTFRNHAEFQQLVRDTLRFHHGHLDLTVKNVRAYPPIVHVHTDLVHTCGHGGGHVHHGINY